MNKNMLIIKGPSNAGKSTTTKLAFDLLLLWAVQKGIASTVHYLYLSKREVGVVIKVGGESIGIASHGDTESHVQKGLTFFALHRCKIVVCTTRLHGKPLQAAQNFAYLKLKVVPTEMSKLQEVGEKVQQEANIKMAKQVVRWIKAACPLVP